MEDLPSAAQRVVIHSAEKAGLECGIPKCKLSGTRRRTACLPRYAVNRSTALYLGLLFSTGLAQPTAGLEAHRKPRPRAISAQKGGTSLDAEKAELEDSHHIFQYAKRREGRPRLPWAWWN